MLLFSGVSMESKFMLQLPKSLRADIKREARRQGITMNDYIVTVLTQFVDIQRGQRERKKD
uniref:Putative nuclease of the RNAse H fold, HicB family n=1 Tax=Podoviridae sp. ctUS21 TaxID=2826557 RepID=A0A8S5MPT5_9CAUD|nr:MAG TPA: putative nuclease of the RNAse H fold, HicB family [Podoviridae sp. ctUS21]